MEENYKKLLGAAYRYLGFRQRSEKEIRDYLKKKTSYANASEGQERAKLEMLINSIIDSLKQQKFLNDEEFARSWVEFRSKNKAWRVIKLELRQKGITDEIIENYELGIKNDGQDRENAFSLAQKRIERLKGETLQKKREKLFRFLSSKGFDYDTIKEAVDKIFPR